MSAYWQKPGSTIQHFLFNECPDRKFTTATFSVAASGKNGKYKSNRLLIKINCYYPNSLLFEMHIKLSIMKKILVPTDFSPHAEKALNYAVQLAKKTGGEIFLVHAVESEMMEGEIQKVAEAMATKTKIFADKEKINISTKVCNGFPLDVILDATREFNIDGVLMGTLGNTALPKKIIGSRTASVIGNSPVPVLAIPLQCEWKIPKKILLAINRFDEKGTDISAVIKMARLFSASVQATIFTDTDDDFVEDYDVHELKIEAYRSILKKQYPDVEIHAVHLAGHHFMENVKNWIANNNIDMMVMLTHKKNIIEKLFEGSMTRKMSYYITIPLLAIPVK